MSNQVFQNVPGPKIDYSRFDLSHNRKLSCKIGELVPVLCQECIPGDEWRISSEVFGRLAPMLAPIMHKVEIFLHAFFIPMRVIWEQAFRQVTDIGDQTWEGFLTGTNPNMDSVPYAALGTDEIPIGGLSDHLGLPPGTYAEGDEEEINIMPHLAYYMIWNEYYRDENLDAKEEIQTSANWPGYVKAGLKFRAWEKDYFTSCWPWAQKGVLSVANVDWEYSPYSTVTNDDGSLPPVESLVTWNQQGATNYRDIITSGHATESLKIENIAEITLDIQELRRANRMQLWMERTARSGSRLTEFLKGHFGTWPRDERLQRPEYIGGIRFPFVISDVTNSTGFVASTDPGSVEAIPMPMGYMAGKGVGYGGGNNMMFKKCEEHGYIMVIMSVRPEAIYYQGIPRMFSKLAYLDFPYPEFANLGEQEVLNKEIFYDGADAGTVNNALFGYQSRYAEYKFIPNSLHGQFRDTLEFWHMARKFSTTPDLNDDFIHIDETNDDLQRVFAVQDVEHVYMQVMHHIECKRPLPFFNMPSLE